MIKFAQLGLKIILSLTCMLFLLQNKVCGQDVPQSVNYTAVYEFIDELANDGYFDLNSAIKPYSRQFIAEKLLEASTQIDKMTWRQRDEVKFYINEFSLEIGQLPESHLNILRTSFLDISFLQPAINYKDSLFKARISPIIGMTISHNSNGNYTKRWYGADFQSSIGKYLSVFASLRDQSMYGTLVSIPSYLTMEPGYEYKEATYGGDFSDSRGGIKLGTEWGSVGLVKDNVVWGDNYHGSNILSGRVPSFPMLTLNLRPCKWFELNYFHGWLVSNVLDSTSYYENNIGQKEYRMRNKFLAANMLTFTPFCGFKFSVGNSIVYAENNIQPGYLIPIAFYKSIDHTMTKGLSLDNQNSQAFLNISSRNIKHVHLYASVYADEIMFSRFSPSTPAKNPISYKLGTNISNFPIKNVSFIAEFTHNNTICYKHTVPALTWASNDYNLGNYLGDNSQELYLALTYKPLKALSLALSYTDAVHGREYEYINRDIDGVERITTILSQPMVGSGGQVIWKNKTLAFNARYEVFSNAYAIVNISWSDIQSSADSNATPVVGEVVKSAQGYLDMFTSPYYQGKQTTVTCGFNIGF